MSVIRTHESKPDLAALEAAVAAARSGFACMFSTSDEYEDALISARRAEGHYGSTIDWQPVLIGVSAVILASFILTVI